MYSIYELTPTYNGDDFRLVESFDTLDDAEFILQQLEKVNISFNYYKIVDMRIFKNYKFTETDLKLYMKENHTFKLNHGE